MCWSANQPQTCSGRGLIRQTEWNHKGVLCGITAMLGDSSVHINQNVSVSYYSGEIWKIFATTSKRVIVYIHWANIMKIKYIFLARNVIKTHFYAETNSKYRFSHSKLEKCPPCFLFSQPESWKSRDLDAKLWEKNRQKKCNSHTI